MRRTIGLITNWYPTKENPYNGVFFKEQAFALREEFDFLVFHFHEHVHLFGGSFFISKSNREVNTKEYNINVAVPIWVYIADFFSTIRRRLSGRQRINISNASTTYRYRYRKKIIAKIVPYFSAEKLDVFYCVDAQTEAGLVRLAAEQLKKPYVISEHGPFPWPGSVLDGFVKDSMEKADAFLAISNDKIRQIMLQNVRLPKTWYVGNMVIESQFSLKPELPRDHIKSFIIVAANSYYKNYDLFIRVMEKLVEITEIPFRVMIVGYAANKGYSDNKETFEEKIMRSKIADRVELVPEVPHTHIAECYHRADAFVMTSIQEGQPVSAMEAACCGLPIFTTRCGGVEDYVTDEIGRVFPIIEVDQFAETLKLFLENKLTFDSLQIRNRIIELFGEKAFCKNMSEVFNSVLLGNQQS